MTSQIVITYVLKTIIISGIFFSYYWIALRDKKFHYYNRFYLLTASIMSLFIPLLKLNWFTVEEPVLYGSNEIVQFILPISNENKTIQFNWVEYSLFIACIVPIVLLSILILNVIKIQLLKRKCEVTKMDGFDFINTNEDNAPFSFLNNLFWKQSISLQEDVGQKIFKHEITHIQQKHTWDRIYCQIITSIFWMNPFNWFIQKELVVIHEFIADEEAVGNSNVEAFAKMLLQTHYGNHFLNPTHQFFYSSIKRRLTMLTKSSNTKYSYLRRVMVLPILMVTVCLVSIKVNASDKVEKTAKAIQNTIDLLVSDTTKPKKATQPIPPNPSLVKPDVQKNMEEIVVVGKGTKSDVQKNMEEIVVVGKGTKSDVQKNMEEIVVVGKGTKSDVQKNMEEIVVVGKGTKSDVQKPAEFPGGPDAWSKYLLNNMDRDLPKRNHAVAGNYFVKLNFVINEYGDVENVIAENNPGYGTASEAIRVIEKGPKWIPAEQNGKKVSYRMKQIIQFNVKDK
jgi:hypothetical protein